jgi:hypothetical protein
VFVDGGYGNVALQPLGWHVALTLTFVAALATAAARIADAAGDRTLTAMLAWSGLFGLGASTYYYAYRSHPDVLLAVFSAWALALALLVIVVLRPGRWSGASVVPKLVVLFGFGLAACSVAQLPPPWREATRIADAAGPTQPLVLSAMADLVRARTHPGERVAVIVEVGHRVAREADVVNDDTLDLLRREGGDTIFVGQPLLPGMAAYLRSRGWLQVHRSPGIGWGEATVIELRRG